MAYIGQGLNRFSNVEKLDVITPATATGAGPYNLTKGSVAFVPSSADTMVVSIDGVIQYGNFSVNGSTITFDAALSDANTCDFIYHMGTGLLSTPVDNSVSTAKIVDSNITTAKINNSAVTDAKIATVAASKLTGALPAISGANLTNLPAETKPTIGSISPSVIENTQTAVTITGTNFISVPQVEAINSTGAIVAADSITFTSATQIVATFTLPVDGTYFLRVENNDGNAVRSGSALLTVSDAPAWTTAAGSIYTGGSVVSTITLSATGATSFAVTTGAVPTGLTFTSGTGSCTIAGTQTEFTAAATKNFSITATDAEGQTAVRAFSMSFTFGMSGSGGFN
ncbi:putative Ig domain-containing protein [bacterium]|nr:putative Ig domain-containing protein [bacterium]